MSKLKTSRMAKFEAAVDLFVCNRDKRDAALKVTAAALAELDALVDSATEAEIAAAENDFEDKFDKLVKLATARTDNLGALLALSCEWIPDSAKN